MHDPLTVAFCIRFPFGKKELPGHKYYPPFITIWHRDPETDGTDDSCDWFGSNRTRETGWYPAVIDEYERLPHEAQMAIDFVWWHWRAKLGRPWWKHPRWHIRHWHIQIHPLQALKRWLFSRCAECGRRFPWDYAPVSAQWDGDGPRWFRGEREVYHHECQRHACKEGMANEHDL